MVNNNDTRSNIFNHCIENNHKPNFDQTKSLKRAVSYWNRLYYESFKINQNPIPINTDNSLEIPAAYKHFMKQL